jgi:hypothetical protein
MINFRAEKKWRPKEQYEESLKEKGGSLRKP